MEVLSMDNSNSQQHELSEAWSMFLIRSAACSALAFHVWEWRSYWVNERKTFWRKRTNTPTAKWIYHAARYLGLIAQLFDLACMMWIHSMSTVSFRTCTTWYTFEASGSVVFTLLLNITLAKRVCALYEGHSGIPKLCVAVIVCGFSVSSYFAAVSLIKGEYHGPCLLGSPVVELVYASSSQTWSQAVLWILIIGKGLDKGLMSHLFGHQGSHFLFTMLPIVFGTTYANFAFTHAALNIDTESLSRMVWPFYITFVNSATCRQVIDMEDASEEEAYEMLQNLTTDASEVDVE